MPVIDPPLALLRAAEARAGEPYGENRHYWKGHFVSELTDELIDELLDRLLAFGRPPVHVLIESLHGAPKAADPALGPIAYRDAAFNVAQTGKGAELVCGALALNRGSA